MARIGRPDVPHWHAGYNNFGYLSESEPGAFSTFEAARDSLAEDMQGQAAGVEPCVGEHGCDDVACPTFRDASPWQRGGDLRSLRDDLLASEGPWWAGSAASLCYWVTACSHPGCAVDESSDRMAPAACSPSPARSWRGRRGGGWRPGVGHVGRPLRPRTALRLLAADRRRGPAPRWPG
jgi:hypothetical protein